jgi:hypothetical protein
MSKKVTVTKKFLDKVLAIDIAAWTKLVQEIIKSPVPESELLHDFGTSTKIDLETVDRTLFIAKGLAPTTNLECKCLAISEDYEPVIFQDKHSRNFIKLVNKSSAKFYVEESVVLKAYDEACSDWKDLIKAEFEGQVSFDEVYRFVEGQQLTTSSFIEEGHTLPVFIGFGLAPTGMEYKTLIVKDEYTVSIVEYLGRQNLVFKRTKD